MHTFSQPDEHLLILETLLKIPELMYVLNVANEDAYFCCMTNAVNKHQDITNLFAKAGFDFGFNNSLLELDIFSRKEAKFYDANPIEEALRSEYLSISLRKFITWQNQFTKELQYDLLTKVPRTTQTILDLAINNNLQIVEESYLKDKSVTVETTKVIRFFSIKNDLNSLNFDNLTYEGFLVLVLRNELSYVQQFVDRFDLRDELYVDRLIDNACCANDAMFFLLLGKGMPLKEFVFLKGHGLLHTLKFAQTPRVLEECLHRGFNVNFSLLNGGTYIMSLIEGALFDLARLVLPRVKTYILSIIMDKIFLILQWIQ